MAVTGLTTVVERLQFKLVVGKHFRREQLTQLLGTQPYVTPPELKDRHPDLTPKQLTDWLKRAVDEGRIERPGKALRYRLKTAAGAQQGLFDQKKD